MTMDAMIVYLEDRGFKATRKYDPTIKKYRFTISREDHNLSMLFEYPAGANNNRRHQLQKEFLDTMINRFDKEFNVESLYPKMMVALMEKKELGYDYIKNYIKNDIKSTNYVSNVINKIIHEKEQEEMENIQWRVVNVDITHGGYYDDPNVEVKLRAYFNGPTRIDPVKLTDILNAKLNNLWPKQNPLVPSTKLPAIEKVIFNDPATIIIWKDGTKTVVKAHNEAYDPEKGFAMAITKKALGNEGNYFETVKKWVGDVRVDPDHSAKWLATQRLYNALGDKKATKADLKFAMEEVIKYLEGDK